jgi:hypothetical protein
MSKWGTFVLGAVGAINIAVSLIGMYWQSKSAYFFLTKYSDPCDPCNPASFRPVLGAMTLINLVFLGGLLVTGIMFVRAKTSGANLYSLIVLTLWLYGLSIRLGWRIGGEIGMSVAAATGVGNIGVSLFGCLFLVPYLYPVVSVVLVQAIRLHQRGLRPVIGV